MKNIIFLVLISLLARITGDSSNVTENKIASGRWLGRNFNEVKSRNFTFTPITKDENENPNDNEPRKVDNENEEKPEKITELNKKISLEIHRKSRDSAGTSNLGIECISCHGSGLRTSDENCYKGAP